LAYLQIQVLCEEFPGEHSPLNEYLVVDQTARASDSYEYESDKEIYTNPGENTILEKVYLLYDNEDSYETLYYAKRIIGNIENDILQKL
jgi:hypothetical protein